jgi:hypothetical protein
MTRNVGYFTLPLSPPIKGGGEKRKQIPSPAMAGLREVHFTTNEAYLYSGYPIYGTISPIESFGDTRWTGYVFSIMRPFMMVS